MRRYFILVCFVGWISILVIRSTTASYVPQSPKCDPLEDLSCQDKCVNKHRQVDYSQKVSCYCDPCCELFHDCCADYDRYCSSYSYNVNNTLVHRCTQDSKSIVTESNKKLWKVYKGDDFKQANGIWMIGSCPKPWPKDDIFYKCTNLSTANTITKDNYQHLPVYTSDGTVYHNSFCALCNGESTHDLKRYLLWMECSVSAPSHLAPKAKMEFLIEYCRNDTITWKLPDKAPRRYSYCMETPCRNNNNPACRSCTIKPARLIHYKNHLYKNSDCADCDWGWHFYQSDVRCGPSGNICWHNNWFPPHQPFSAIFDFNSDSTIKTEMVQRYCILGEVYDHYLDTCRKMLSIQGPPTASTDDRYHVVFWLKTSLKLQNVDITQEIARFFQIPNEQITGVNVSAKWITEIQFHLRIAQNESTFTQTKLGNVFQFSSPFTIMIGNKSFLVFKVTSRRLTCTDLETYTRDTYKLGNNSEVVIIKTGEVLKPNQYYSNGTLGINNTAIFVCRNHLNTNNTCHGNWVLMKDGEYYIFNNDTIFVNASNKIYDAFQYLWVNQSLYVCENFTKFKTVIKSFTNATPGTSNESLSIMTLVGMSLSISALAFVLITYSLFSELRTPPGINLMNLSVSILLAQLLWLLGSGQTDSPKVCTAIAVLLHYLFLVSFMWTSIIAFDTWRAFTAKGRRGLSKYKNLRYMSVAWLASLLYVGICVLLDFTNFTNIGYRSDRVCWISNPSAILYFFAVPVAMVLLFNLFLYTLTVKAIHVAKAQARFAAADKDRKKSFGIYVRIASAMGFTWIFGFIAPFGLGFLWYVFVFFNSLQGVYISIAFVFNKRVIKLYKRLVGNVEIPSNRLSSQSNISSSTIQIDSVNTKL